jgi:hypothetical protein
VKGTYAVSNISIADHLAITAHILINDDKLKSKPTFEYREMKENNWMLFKHGKMETFSGRYQKNS